MLRITDGTTTVTLSGGGVSAGCTYFPDAPKPETGKAESAADFSDVTRRPVTESATLVLAGTASAILDTTHALDRLVEAAERRQRTGVGQRVFVEYQETDGAAIYRSELYTGRLTWSDAPGRRRLNALHNTVEVLLSWTRAWYWEGPETPLLLTSSATPTPSQSVTLYNSDGANPAQSNWVQVGVDQIEGVLPAPLRVQVTNQAAQELAWQRFFLANNSFSSPATFGHLLRGSQSAYGPSASWTGASGHNVLRYVWDLSDATLAACGGRFFRILARLDITSGAFVRPALYMKSESAYLFDIYAGDEVDPGPGGLLDLGAIPIPPIADVATADVALALSVRSQDSGSAYLDFVQLTPADPGAFRRVTQFGFGVPQGDGFVDDGIEGVTYYYDAGGNRFPIMQGLGEPLHAWPQRVQRLYVLNDENIGEPMALRAWHRPRRLTL